MTRIILSRESANTRFIEIFSFIQLVLIYRIPELVFNCCWVRISQQTNTECQFSDWPCSAA